MKISVVINCDSRPENGIAERMFEGTSSYDFLLEGVLNKVNFFKGFNTEFIVHIDHHLDIPPYILEELQTVTDTLIIRRHTGEENFNDYNYLRGLKQATGDIVVHFDQDTAAFTSSPEPIQKLIDLLDTYKYVSYPSYWSPNPCEDATFNYFWASTRFFMCKRETLDFAEIQKCLTDYDYFVAKYKPSRVCHWLEHILSLTAGNSVFYPPLDTHNYTIFSWGSYKEGTLKMLNQMNYEGIKNWGASHPIRYPNDVDA